MPKFNIEIRDPQYKRVGRFEQYERFEAIIRYCDVGTWTMDVDAGLPESVLLVEGGGIIVWAEGLDAPLFSGPLKTISRKWDEANPGELITFSGVTDELWLNERVIYPDPFQPLGSQPDRQSGTITAAGALSYLTHYNLAAGALPERRHPYVIVDDVDVGPTFSLSARFDVLGEYLQKIALSSGYGYQMIHNNENIRFRIFKPVDRSGTVIFSPDLGNLAGYNYGISAPTATRIIVAAQGEGKDRYLKEYVANTNQFELVNDNDPRITYTAGTWVYSTGRPHGDYLSDVHYSSTSNAVATFTFTGTGIAYYTERNTDMGTVEIWLDDVFQTNVTCNTTGSRQVQVMAWERVGFAPGEHTLKLVNKGSGTTTDMLVDYFKVYLNSFSSSGQDWTSLAPERFVDRRDIPIKRGSTGLPVDPTTGAAVTATVLSELNQAGTEAVLEASGTASLSVTPIDTETIKFGRDYQLGDIVSVSINGVSLTDVLREVRLIDSIGEGARVYPVVGTTAATETPYLYRKVKELETALKRLEARL